MSVSSVIGNKILLLIVVVVLLLGPLYLSGVVSVYLGFDHFYGEQYAERYAKMSFDPRGWIANLKFLFDYWWPNRAHPSMGTEFQLKFFGPFVGSVLLSLFTLFFIRAPLMDFRPFKKKETLHGDAHWASEGEVRSSGLRAKKGLIIGRTGVANYLIADDFQHVLLFAPTGSGKGVGFVIPNMLFWEDSVVCHDIKLENYELTSGYRVKMGQEVYIWNPADPDGYTHCYNPLDCGIL